MNTILADIYSTVIPSAPFIIAAYALVWAALLVYVIITVSSLKKTEAQVALLEEAIARKAEQRIRGYLFNLKWLLFVSSTPSFCICESSDESALRSTPR